MRRGTTTASLTGPGEIQAKGLTFTYPGKDTPAVHGVDLTIRRGEIVALIGENGSGKTTLAKLLTGLYLPASGEVTWDGQDLARPRPRERVAGLRHGAAGLHPVAPGRPRERHPRPAPPRRRPRGAHSRRASRG
ncbi:hypothetical protein GCM10020000_85450 [Streptomyces olivoverticillatus]